MGLVVFTLATLLVAGGTVAWFTANQAKANSFTAGTVKIEVEETFSGTSNWQKGQTVSKEVSVKSKGTKDSYVRVALTPVWSDPSLPIDNVILNFSEGSSWTGEIEGWYYYKSILAGGAETNPLLASVTLDEDLTDGRYEGAELTILVSAEGVQASHEAYKTVWGLTALPTGVEVWTP